MLLQQQPLFKVNGPLCKGHTNNFSKKSPMTIIEDEKSS